MWMNGGLALGVVVAACISEIAKGCWFSRCVLYALLPLALSAAPAVVPASSITSGVAIATCFSPEDLALLLFGDLKGIGTGDALALGMHGDPVHLHRQANMGASPADPRSRFPRTMRANGDGDVGVVGGEAVAEGQRETKRGMAGSAPPAHQASG